MTLAGTVQTQKAEMGVLVMMGEPSAGVLDAANHGGNYTWPANNAAFPRIQVITIEELLQGARPKTPPLLLPFTAAPRAPSQTHIQDTLLDD